MLARSFFALTFGLAALLASTRATYAANFSERDEVMIGTGAVVLGVMLFLFVIYLIRHTFGLDKMPPPEPDAGNAHH